MRIDPREQGKSLRVPNLLWLDMMKPMLTTPAFPFAVALLLGAWFPAQLANASPPVFDEPHAMTDQQRDRLAITKVVENIALGADLHQWNLVRASFAPEVVLDYGTAETVTPAAIVGRWEPLLEAFDATHHQLSELAVTVEGDRATASARFQATHWLHGAAGGDLWVLSGRYEYELVRGTEGWRVSRMRMQPQASTGNDGLLDLARQKAGKAADKNHPKQDRKSTHIGLE